MFGAADSASTLSTLFWVSGVLQSDARASGWRRSALCGKGRAIPKMERKLNCWEYMHCGRESGGVRDSGVDECPAAQESMLHGTHGGQNAGRACWVVAGTMCRDAVSGTFASKFKDCKICPFYAQVKQEEHPAFKLSTTLLATLQSDK